MKISLNFWQILRGAGQNILPVLLCLGLLATAATAKTTVHTENEGIENSSTPNITVEPSATFQRLWIDYGVTEGGKTGMRIHTDFKVINMKGIEGYLALYFQQRDGTALQDTNGAFNSADDTVAVYKEISPGYATTVYEDYDIFMPYDELDLGPGSYKLRIDASVIYKQGGLISRLTYYDFDYTNPKTTTTTKKPSATFDRMWVDYNVTQGGRRGMRIHIKSNVFDMKDGNGYLAFYFQKQDGTKLTTTNRTYRSNERPGQLALYFEITPGFQNTVYEDAQVFMPYDELNLRSGYYELQMDVDLIEKDGTMIQHINMYNFWYEKD